MNTVYRINLVSYLITLGLYLTLTPGMLAQFVLGIIQIVLFIHILYRFRGFPKAVSQDLKIYLALVAIDGLAFTTIATSDLNTPYPFLVTLFVIPMLIAAYFVHITYKLKTAEIQMEEIDEIDMIGI